MLDNVQLILGLMALGGAGLGFSAFVKHVSAPTPPPDGVRLFAEQLGAWPQVFQAVPGMYEFYALYTRPTASIFDKPTDPVLYFTHEMICWASPDGHSYKIPLNNLKMHVEIPHRLAEKEAREHQNTTQFQARMQEQGRDLHNYRMQRHDSEVRAGRIKGYMIDTMKPGPYIAINMPPPSPKYQIASELIIRTGSGDQIWLPVAEFADDSRGERANQLYHAIDYVKNQCLKEAAALAEKQPAAAQEQAAPQEPFE